MVNEKHILRSSSKKNDNNKRMKPDVEWNMEASLPNFKELSQ